MSYAANEGGRDRLTARAAIFVDYENLYHLLSANVGRYGEAGPLISEMIEALKRSLLEERQTQTAVSQAYADFTELNGRGDALQRALYLQGVESRFVPQSLQANAAEIQLCVDAMDLLHHRADIDTFVLLTGSRSYLPLVQHFKRYGRRVMIVALEEPASIDHVSHIDDEWFFDARDLLSSSGRRGLYRAKRPPTSETDEIVSTDPPAIGSVNDPVLIRGLEIIDEHFGHYDEVYLTPLLRRMSEILDERTCDPKAVISELEDLGAVRLEKRQGFPHDYTVLIVEHDHPDVERVKQQAAGPYYYDDVQSSYETDDDFFHVSVAGREEYGASDSDASGFESDDETEGEFHTDRSKSEFEEDDVSGEDIRDSSQRQLK